MDIMPNETLQQKLPASIATNTAPDFVLFGVENIAPYVSNDSLEDISDFGEATGTDKSNYLENVVDLSYVDGKLYGTPMQYNVVYLYWNKDLFKAAGFDPETPPANLGELSDYAAKLTDSSKNQFGLGLPANATYMQFLWANGRDADNPSAGKNLLNSEENLNTLKWLQDLTVNQKVTPMNVTGSDADVMLQAGQIAMYPLHRTETLVQYIYDSGFQTAPYDLGYASSQSVYLFIMIAVITFILETVYICFGNNRNK